MTSPVDTTVKWFSSTMLGAPVLKGQAGSLIAILDACLVNGWGVQAASSCVVAGGICTMTFPLDHAALQECVVQVEGASIALLNGEQKITATEPNTLKFATTAANGTATGTITVKMAPGGWAKPFFSGTTVGVYKSLNPAANGQFCRVNDAGTTDARVVGYETMTAVSTGTLLFPTSTQLSGGLFWAKSAVAQSTFPIDWRLVTDGRIFYILIGWYAGNEGLPDYKTASLGCFGDTLNLGRSADPFNTLVLGQLTAVENIGAVQQLTTGDTSRRFFPKISAGTGTAQPANIFMVGNPQPQDDMWDRHSGQIRVSEFVLAAGNSWRSKLPGLALGVQSFMETWFPWEPTIITLGPLNRKHLTMRAGHNPSGPANLYLMTFDVTGPWR